MRLKLSFAVLAVVLLLAGCGEDSTSSSRTNGGTRTAATTTATTATPELFVNKLPKPKGPGPHPGARVDRLIVKDVRVGDGPEIHAGDTGIFDFIATNWVTGRPLDSSWRRRRPFETQIERGVVIDGWWQGIPGMRVGGRRQLIIPPALGFASSLVADLRGATTYFDVVLLGIRRAQPRGLQGAAGG